MDTLLNKKDVAARLGVSARTTTRLIESGHLKALKIGAQVRIRQSDLDKFIAAQLKAGAR
ncbi:hypothetical protein JNB_04645 [Janibacter sp. HTCC2649]|uniref:helix-turn-helix domain-containing protein n=1 Tax=Janibacter sp. HTCC2649 TaxID=313589 RepID=UPI000066EB52|nr:helix-turn-helix domain-containing protein [Janibacter sp. HTCC2649]EAP99431.1 hypothetical protein JNB_04645 [Janibacter sp. HTCC2649]